MSKRVIRDERGVYVEEQQIADQLFRCGLNEQAFYAATVCLTDRAVMHFLAIYGPAKAWFERGEEEVKLSDYILGHKNGAVGNFKKSDPAIKQNACCRSVYQWYQWQQESPTRNTCGCGGIVSFNNGLMLCSECGFKAHIRVSAAEVFGLEGSKE